MKEAKIKEKNIKSVFYSQNLLPVVKVNIFFWLFFYFSFVLIIPIFFYGLITLYFIRKRKRIDEVANNLDLNLQKQRLILQNLNINLKINNLNIKDLEKKQNFKKEFFLALDQIDYKLKKNNTDQKRFLKNLLNSKIVVDYQLQNQIQQLIELKQTNEINQNLYNVYAKELNNKIFSWPSAMIAYLMNLAPLPIY